MHTDLDPDLHNLRQSLHSIDDDKLFEIQKRRNRRGVAKRLDGDYNLLRALDALGDDCMQQLAPYEYQCSQYIAEQIGRPPRPGNIYVPVRRDLTEASAPGGGFLVGTDVAPGNTFVDYLDQFFPFQKLGISRLSLTRPATIPAMSGTVTSYWLQAENTSLTESQFIFVSRATTPKTVGAYIEISNQLLKQATPFALDFVLRNMARAVAAEVSRKLVNGSGTDGELQGVLGYAGVSSLPAASANLTLALGEINAVEEDSGLVNPASAGFAMAPDVALKARSRELASGSGMLMVQNTLAGYPGVSTKGVPDSTLVFGDWSQLLLLEYGILEVGRDPYGATGSDLFRTGRVGIRALWIVDSILLNPSSFCKSEGVS